MASSRARKENPPLCLWSSAKVEYLIARFEDYKSEIDYKNVDFFSDVIALFFVSCFCIRRCMAFKFVVELPNK